MSLQATFSERLEQMENTRNQRLSLLQSEKELQMSKSGILASKLSRIRSMEQRCLKLDCKIASQHLTISSLKSELHRFDSVYCEILQKLRTLKTEVEELEQLEKEKEIYYEAQNREMEDFRTQVDTHTAIFHVQVEELRNQTNELKLNISKLQSGANFSDNLEISAAEIKKSELLVQKDRLDKSLASNYQLKGQLRKQLQTILADQSQRSFE